MSVVDVWKECVEWLKCDGMGVDWRRGSLCDGAAARGAACVVGGVVGRVEDEWCRVRLITGETPGRCIVGDGEVVGGGLVWGGELGSVFVACGCVERGVVSGDCVCGISESCVCVARRIGDR